MPILLNAPGAANVRGAGAWLAVVRTYQTCSETLSLGIKPLGLKLAQHDVLMHLLLSQALTQQQLAERSYVTKSHMSALLIEMQALGWIERADSQADKRSKVIGLTEQGMALALQAWQLQERVIQTMMAPLSDAQIEDLRQFSVRAHKDLQALQQDLAASELPNRGMRS
jgi:DNA-binding MarR family transcriptional regulator